MRWTYAGKIVSNDKDMTLPPLPLSRPGPPQFRSMSSTVTAPNEGIRKAADHTM